MIKHLFSKNVNCHENNRIITVEILFSYQFWTIAKLQASVIQVYFPINGSFTYCAKTNIKSHNFLTFVKWICLCTVLIWIRLKMRIKQRQRNSRITDLTIDISLKVLPMRKWLAQNSKMKRCIRRLIFNFYSRFRDVEYYVDSMAINDLKTVKAEIIRPGFKKLK